MTRQVTRKGLPVLLLLVALNLLSITLGLVLSAQKQPGTLAWMNDPRKIQEMVAEHATAGFVVGMAKPNLQRALIGTAFQPLMDVDHVTAYLNLPVDPRIGHSLFVLVALTLVVSSLRMWPWGRVDFGLFASAQFAIHFAIAPPGFPLLAPFAPTKFYFPSLIPTMAGVLVVLLNFMVSRGVTKWEHPGGPRKATS